MDERGSMLLASAIWIENFSSPSSLALKYAFMGNHWDVLDKLYWMNVSGAFDEIANTIPARQIEHKEEFSSVKWNFIVISLSVRATNENSPTINFCRKIQWNFAAVAFIWHEARKKLVAETQTCCLPYSNCWSYSLGKLRKLCSYIMFHSENFPWWMNRRMGHSRISF